jgi:hypothetical protein
MRINSNFMLVVCCSSFIWIIIFRGESWDAGNFALHKRGILTLAGASTGDYCKPLFLGFCIMYPRSLFLHPQILSAFKNRTKNIFPDISLSWAAVISKCFFSSISRNAPCQDFISNGGIGAQIIYCEKMTSAKWASSRTMHSCKLTGNFLLYQLKLPLMDISNSSDILARCNREVTLVSVKKLKLVEF